MRTRITNKMGRRRAIGLLGGSFDPVHRGHVVFARRAAKELPVNSVRLVPNGAPPHRREPQLSWSERVNLCEREAANIARVHVGREEPPGETRWTIDTVRRHLRRRRRVILLLGADAFADFDCWRGWSQLLRFVNIAVARRGGRKSPRAAVRARIRRAHSARSLQEGAGRVLWWQFRPGDISSTQIRAGR